MPVLLILLPLLLPFSSCSNARPGDDGDYTGGEDGIDLIPLPPTSPVADRALLLPLEARVAIYSDDGADPDCVTATEALFLWMGAKVEEIDGMAISNGGLEGFDLLIFPGGWAADYIYSLGFDGVLRVREAVMAGLGYIGICAGAYLASSFVVWEGEYYDYPLDLFSGNAVGPIEDIAPWPESAMCFVEYRGTPFRNPEEGAHLLYLGGPYFDGGSFEEVAIYGENGLPAMVAGDFGEGRVFLTGPHPEIEEGEERDGVDAVWERDLEDPETDWNFMKRAALWVLGGE